MFEDDACVKVWAGRRGLSGEDAVEVFERFLAEGLKNDSALSSLSPSELVDFQFSHMNNPKERFRILEAAQTWVNGLNVRRSSKKVWLSMIRSFFMHNRCDLPFDHSFHFSSDVPPVEGNLTVENLRRIVLNCDPRYRSMFLMMFQGLMDEKRFCYINVKYAGEILEHVTKNDGEFTLYLPGRKGGAPFHTILSTRGDWFKTFKEYMRVTDNDFSKALFLNDFGKPILSYNIAYYFREHAFKCGVVKRVTPQCDKCGFETVRVHRRVKTRVLVIYRCKNCGNELDASCLGFSRGTSIRYGVNPHEMRDLARTRIEEAGVKKSAVEYWLGHTKQVDPNEYLSYRKYGLKLLAQEYRKALPFLNILSEEPDKIERSQVEMKFEGQKAQIELIQGELAVLRRRQEWFDNQKVKDWINKKLKEEGIEY